MRKNISFAATMLACVAALVASAILLVDYVRPAPVFCDSDGGCGLMKRTAFAYPLGIPTPAIGIAGFLAIAFVALVPGRRARIGQAMLAVFAGVVALGFIGVQIAMKHICPYCAVADTCALLLAGLSIHRAMRADDPPTAMPALGAAVGATLLAVTVPLVLGFTRRALPKDFPAALAKDAQDAPRGRVTVIDFVDFECPFCRMTHAELAPLVKEKKLHVVRKQVPLRMHPHAMDAAKAACCAEKLGKGDAMADALMTAPSSELTPEGCAKLARELSLDAKAFEDCVNDPATAARIEKDKQTFKDVKGHGLPLLFVGSVRLDGAQSGADLRAAVTEAEREL